MRSERTGGARGRFRPGPALALALAGVILACALHAAVLVGGWREIPTSAPCERSVYQERGLRELVAAIHVHTRLSWDGAGTLEGAVAAARGTGVEAVFLAEHDRPDSWQYRGVRDGVLVVPGVEVGTAEGHYAVYGVPGPELAGLYDRRPDEGPYKGSPRPRALDSLAALYGGVTIVAHPRGGRKPWRGVVPAGAAGIEIINADVEWRNDSVPDLLRALFFFPFDSRASFAFLVDRPASALALWDSLLQTRPTVGIAGLDAHGGLRLSERASIPFPSYRAVMGVTRQHLLVPDDFSVDAPEAAGVLLDALAAGRSFAGCDALGSTRGFAFWGESPEGPAGEVALMGEVLPLRQRSVLHARLPRGAPLVVRLLLDGVVVAEERIWEFAYPVERPGAYRVEVCQRRRSRLGGTSDLPWIFSNPIYVADRADPLTVRAPAPPAARIAGRGMPD